MTNSTTGTTETYFTIKIGDTFVKEFDMGYDHNEKMYSRVGHLILSEVEEIAYRFNDMKNVEAIAKALQNRGLVGNVIKTIISTEKETVAKFDYSNEVNSVENTEDDATEQIINILYDASKTTELIKEVEKAMEKFSKGWQ